MSRTVQNITTDTLWLPHYGWPGLGLTLPPGGTFTVADADADQFGGGMPSAMWLVI